MVRFVLVRNIIDGPRRLLEGKAKMNSKKVFVVWFVILAFVFLAGDFGFSQTQKEPMTIVYGGIIKRISKDYKSMVVNSENILITSNTKIFDEKGQSLKIENLKPDLYVMIEGIESKSGLLARKITVKKPPQV